MGLLKNVHPTIAEILDGKHDGTLRAFVQAVEFREKQMRAASGLRKGSLIVVTDGRIAGREGIIEKVNQKSFSIALTCPTCGSCKAVSEGVAWEDRCGSCSGFPEQWRVSGNVLRVRTPEGAGARA